MISLKDAIIPFCDVATDVEHSDDLTNESIKFVRNGESIFAKSDKINGKIEIRKGDVAKVYSSLGSLISSRDFADTESLFDAQTRIFAKERANNIFDPEKLIDPAGHIDGEDLSLQTFIDATAPSGHQYEQLSIILIDGPAGVGKTSLIRRLMWERCKQRKLGENVQPILHVVNRGRGLATLSDFLARATQSSGAKFTYSQVPVLVRLGLLQVCIDGFDELADPAGYLDAWEALRQFFEETKSGGPILLAGRDTFFDVQSFRESVKSSSVELKTRRARLAPIARSTATDYLRKSGWPDMEISKLEKNDFLEDGSYSLRPYFLSVLAGLDNKSWNNISKNRTGPKYFLIESMIDRESNLLDSTIKESKGINHRQIIENFLGEVALEMAATETAALDIPYLELIAETQLRDKLTERDLGRLVSKVGSIAMLERDESSPKMRKFSHSEIYDYYLAKGLIREICDGQFTGAVKRGTLGISVFRIIADILTSSSGDLFDGFSRNVYNEYLKNPYGRFGQNVASLSMTTLGRDVLGIVRLYKDISIEEAYFPNEIVDCRMENVFFLRLDVMGANCEKLYLDDDCQIETLLLNEATRFYYHPNVRHVQFSSIVGLQNLREPEEIAKKLMDRESVESPAHSDEASKLFERLCRVFLRQHWLKLDQEDPVARSLMRDRYFDNVISILKKYDRMYEDDNLGAGGAPGRFIHIRRAINLLDFSRQTGEEESIWREVYDLV